MESWSTVYIKEAKFDPALIVIIRITLVSGTWEHEFTDKSMSRIFWRKEDT